MASGSENLNLESGDWVGCSERGSWRKEPRPKCGVSYTGIVMQSDTEQLDLPLRSVGRN